MRRAWLILAFLCLAPAARAQTATFEVFRTGTSSQSTCVPTTGFNLSQCGWKKLATTTSKTYTDVPGAGQWWYSVSVYVTDSGGTGESAPSQPYVKVTTTTSTNKVALSWSWSPGGAPNAPTGIGGKTQ